MQDLLNNLEGCSICGVLRDGLANLQAYDAVFPEGIPSAMEAGAADAKTPARLANSTDRLSMLQNLKLVLRLTSELVHRHHPCRLTGF
jgi:hypothetical protein